MTAREVQRLDGPTNGVAMEILEIDADSGLVVGLNGCARARGEDESMHSPPRAAVGLFCGARDARLLLLRWGFQNNNFSQV